MKEQPVANNIWFPFYMGSYLSKTQHLSQAEHGAYLCLLLYYYSHKAQIPHNRRYAICRAFAEQEQAACDMVLSEYFTRQGDMWLNEKAEEEIQRAEDISKKRSDAAKSKGQQMQSNCKANAEQLDTQLQLQSHIQIKEQLDDVQQAAPQNPTKAKSHANNGTSITTSLGENPILPAEWANFASSEFGWSQARIDSTFARFVDYWRGKSGAGGRKSDWLATWRNWVRSDEERSPRGASQTGRGMRNDSAAVVSAVVAARYGTAPRSEGVSRGDDGMAEAEGGNADIPW